jgi:putative ABC transport system ATP-binding protein
MSQISIRCRNVKKFYGIGENEVQALKPTDLEIESGKLTLLVGPTGSGKSTLISIIATILTPDSGEVILLDEQVQYMDEEQKALFRNKNLGIVFQSLFLIPTLTLAENVALPLIVGGMEEKPALAKALEYLDMVHLANRADSPPTAFSKGQQQKVAIARAMINEAPIIICDEPTSSLDHTSGFEMMEFLHKLAINSSKTVLVVTHDPRIFSYADRIISMSDGEISEQKIL